jgi:hypothetical protein
MSALYNAYVRDIHKELDLFAYWEPTDPPLQLGDFGEMDGKKFNRKGNIKEFGKIILKERQSAGSDRYYQSEKDVNFSSKVGAVSTGAAKGTVTISFSKSDAFVFRGEDITIKEIDNLSAVEDFLVDVYKDKGKEWRLSYVVVTKISLPKRLLAILSQSKGSSVTLSGKVSQAVTGIASVNLEDLTVTSTKGTVSVYIDNDGGTTPLFALHEIKDPITKKAFLTEYK